MPRLPAAVRQRILERDHYRCAYCLAPQKLLYASLRIDHIIPESKGGTDDEANLCACCDRSNSRKYNKTTGVDPETEEEVLLFNSVTQNWHAHFAIAPDGVTILGITPTGRATITALGLNAGDALTLRKLWAQFGAYPPAGQ